MIALILCIAITLVFGIIGHVLLDRFYSDLLGDLSVGTSLLAGITSVVMIIFAIVVNVGTDGMIAAKQQLYDSLTYQLEHDLYDNDNDIGKKELYSQITDWNADLAQGKAMQHDKWVGIFYPNIYDGFDFIVFEEAGTSSGKGCDEK